tara:strand:- start:448 stop:1644 length:1197 start_codon:yes stop_codon:yes gene_type:complete
MKNIKFSPLNIKLAIMMLFQYSIWGIWYVTLGNYIVSTLGFTGFQTGMIYGTFAVAAIFSPVVVGVLTDKYFSPVNVLAFLHLTGGGILFYLSLQKTYDEFYWVTLAYALCYMPTITLTNVIALKQLSNPEKEFPFVRVLGTIGWIIAGIVVSFLGYEASNTPITLAAGLSITFGFLSFLLPNQKTEKTNKTTSGFRSWFSFEGFTLLKDRNFSILIIASLLISIPLSFYYSFSTLFLSEIGIENAAGKMTIGQVSEIVFMLVLPFFIKKWGIKKVVLIAMFAWAVRYVLFAFGNQDLVVLLYIAIALHGVCYDFFFVAGQLYVDKFSPKHLKGAAQGLLTQATYGVGMFIGAMFSGIVVDNFKITEGHDWESTWMVPAFISLMVMILFGILFKSKKA